MNIIKFYLILSAALTLFTDKFFPLFRQSYSIWAVPLSLIGFFVALILLHTIVFFVTVFLASTKKKPSKLSENFFRFLVKLTLPVLIPLAGVKIESEGCDALPENKNILFVCNHQHNFDPVIIFSAFPEAKISFIGKKDILTEMKFVAKAMSLLSCLFIDRENDREAAKTIISAIKYLKDGERSVGLFPEGYCSKTGELQPLRNGSLKIALKAKVPVAVCVINNTRQIQQNMFRRKTIIRFRLVEVLSPEVYENMSTAELGDLIHSKMEKALEEIKKPR